MNAAIRPTLVDIAARTSACPGPGGKILNAPIEVHSIMGSPTEDEALTRQNTA